MHEFNQSLKYDQRMYDADIRGSIAYAKALADVGILTQQEQVKLVEGLTKVGQEWKDGVVRVYSPMTCAESLKHHHLLSVQDSA